MDHGSPAPVATSLVITRKQDGSSSEIADVVRGAGLDALRVVDLLLASLVQRRGSLSSGAPVSDSRVSSEWDTRGSAVDVLLNHNLDGIGP
ncbi:unnamed protein product, partial [Discosporangium mesarthrocarpum]